MVPPFTIAARGDARRDSDGPSRAKLPCGQRVFALPRAGWSRGRARAGGEGYAEARTDHSSRDGPHCVIGCMTRWAFALDCGPCRRCPRAPGSAGEGPVAARAPGSGSGRGVGGRRGDSGAGGAEPARGVISAESGCQVRTRKWLQKKRPTPGRCVGRRSSPVSGHFTSVYTAACATSRTPLLTDSMAWWPLSAAPFAALMVTVTVPDSPAPRVSVDGLTEKDTPLEVTSATVSEKVSRAPWFVIVIATERLCPDPEGTAPKLTLTGSSATRAPTALSRFSRPAPMTFTSSCGFAVS